MESRRKLTWVKIKGGHFYNTSMFSIRQRGLEG